MAPITAPVRVDFAGGWLDVPAFARPSAFIVNCAVTPMMSIAEPFYESGGGVGGSATWALLHGKNAVKAELDNGRGWQDPAVVQETGLCVWRSAIIPSLHLKTPGEMVMRKMALEWTGIPHSTPGILNKPRNYDKIAMASRAAAEAVHSRSYSQLCYAVTLSYAAQREEGMADIIYGTGCCAVKYCGSGWGGYILRMYKRIGDRMDALKDNPELIPIEPYIRNWT